MHLNFCLPVTQLAAGERVHLFLSQVLVLVFIFVPGDFVCDFLTLFLIFPNDGFFFVCPLRLIDRIQLTLTFTKTNSRFIDLRNKY